MSDLSRGDLSREEKSFPDLKKRSKERKTSCRGFGEVTCKMEEIDARGIDAILVDLQRKATKMLEEKRGKDEKSSTHEMRRHPTREQCLLIRLRQALQQGIQAHLIHQRLRNSSAHNAMPTWNIIIQIRTLQLCLEVIES